MIRAIFFTAEGDSAADAQTIQPVGFSVSGHTGERGSSVVCAAVSSACYMAANTITDVIRLPAEVSQDDGLMSLTLPTGLDSKDGERAGIILKGLLLHLEQLAQQYPHDIRLDVRQK